MKRKLIGGLLTLSLLTGTCGAAFRDISDPALAQTAAVLSSLKIMQGTGADTFNPEGHLTRGEFARLLVTALGVTDVTAYKSYTIFPDVPHTHWAAGYINAAIKHPDVKKKNVIHGYADGTFKPDQTISYGEACTMLLLMMGYTVEDIGPIWPGDYIARAQSSDLTSGASVMTASSPVKRADAAIMLLNTLNTPGKEDAKLISTLTSSAGAEGAILLATSETDSDLSKNQALFYTGSEEPEKKITEGVLDSALIGVSGTIYYSKTSPKNVVTVLPDTDGRNERYTIRRTQSDRIETTEETTIKPERNVMVYVRGEVHKFSEAWFDLLPGDDISLHYNKEGELELISTTTATSAGGSVYGTKTASPIPAGFKIVKNGAVVDAGQLKKYDVISLDAGNKTAVVSDNRITGLYTSASPSYKNPDSIEVLGRKFSIPSQAAGYFTDLEQGDRITLLLDSHGQVAAVYPASEVKATMSGVFTSLNDGKAQIKLFSGITVSAPLADKDDEYLAGRAVSVTAAADGKIHVGPYTPSGKGFGAWNVEEGLLGTRRVSPNVRVWEMTGDKMPLYETAVNKLPLSTIPSSSIRGTIIDSAGTVTTMILGDVTGDAWNYGIASFGSTKTEAGSSPSGKVDEDGNQIYETDYKYDYTVSLKTMLDGENTRLTYSVIGKPTGLTGGPVGLPKGAELSTAQQDLPIKNLTRVGSVDLTSFDGEDGVRTSSGYYPLADEVSVYISGDGKFISLRQAKADYTSFSVYADDIPGNGGKIRIIMVD